MLNTTIPRIDMEGTGRNIRRLMDLRKLETTDVQRALGLSDASNVRKWCRGQHLPSIDSLYALSDVLRVPLDAIICGTRPPITPEDICGL